MTVRLTGLNGLIPTAKTVVDPPQLYKGQLYRTNSKNHGIPLFTLALDMVDLMCDGLLEEGSDAVPIIDKGAGVMLEWTGKGSQMFKSSFSVYVDGEKFGTLAAHPRSLQKGLKERSVQLHIDNALLYSADWYPLLLHVLDVCSLQIQNVTRVDICLDGLNHIIPFLNNYQKQTAENKKVHQLGKARFSAGVLDKTTMLYDHFRIGTATSEKHITVYNKSKELEQSNKTYIEKYWKANGLDLSQSVYRVELRMRGGAIKQIKGFDLARLTDYKYLFDIFKTGCHNYFEFTETVGQKNVSRQKPIELIPFDKLGAVLLEKVPRPLSDGRYKAKMAVHLTVKDVVMQNIPATLHTEAFSMMEHDLKIYDLRTWFVKRFPDWIIKYGKLAAARTDRPEPEKRLHEFFHRYAQADA